MKYSNAQIREAILKAADRIERNPDGYNFYSNGKPDCGSPGCMMGWIGFELGFDAHPYACYVTPLRDALGFDYSDIGDMIRAAKATMPHNEWHRLMNYQERATEAAEVMRLYADHRFPQVRETTVPWSACEWKPKAVA